MAAVGAGAGRLVRRGGLSLAVLCALVAGLVALAAGVGAGFAGATDTSLSWAAGTVHLTGNDAGSAMFSLAGMVPGQSVARCVAVSYSGSLPARVRLYASAAAGLADYLDMTVTRGSSSPDPPDFTAGDGCGTFTPDSATYAGPGGVVYTGTLAAYAAAYPDFASGLPDPVAATPAVWTTGERHVYRVVLTLRPDAAAEGLSATPTLVWEARNT
jgi:hypothetical protein